MSTVIYPGLSQSEISQLEQANKQKEQRWLVDKIIKPELPSIKEALGKCISLIVESDDVKLPITSSRTEQVKGIIIRNSTRIEGLDLNLNFKSLSTKKLHLKLKESVELDQLKELLNYMNQAISDTHLISQMDDNDDDDIQGFMKQLNKILQTIIKCNVILNKPNASLMFPQHKINLLELFEDPDKKLEQYQRRLTLDFFLLNSEISMEFIGLENVTESPWCDIDLTTGQSHIDKLRDDLKHHRTNLNDILAQDKKKLGHILGLNKFSTNDYLTRGITFDGRVVIEAEKLLIHCQDPNLLSVGAKLTGLERMVGKMYRNLDLALM